MNLKTDKSNKIYLYQQPRNILVSTTTFWVKM